MRTRGEELRSGECKLNRVRCDGCVVRPSAIHSGSLQAAAYAHCIL